MINDCSWFSILTNALFILAFCKYTQNFWEAKLILILKRSIYCLIQKINCFEIKNFDSIANKYNSIMTLIFLLGFNSTLLKFFVSFSLFVFLSLANIFSLIFNLLEEFWWWKNDFKSRLFMYLQAGELKSNSGYSAKISRPLPDLLSGAVTCCKAGYTAQFLRPK